MVVYSRYRSSTATRIIHLSLTEIADIGGTIPESNIEIVERGKIDTNNTQIKGSAFLI